MPRYFNNNLDYSWASKSSKIAWKYLTESELFHNINCRRKRQLNATYRVSLTNVPSTHLKKSPFYGTRPNFLWDKGTSFLGDTPYFVLNKTKQIFLDDNSLFINIWWSKATKECTQFLWHIIKLFVISISIKRYIKSANWLFPLDRLQTVLQIT